MNSGITLSRSFRHILFSNGAGRRILNPLHAKIIRSYTTNTPKKKKVIDVAGLLVNPFEAASQSNGKKTDPLLEWLETSNSALDSNSLRLLALESEIKNLAVKFGPRKAISFITSVLRKERKEKDNFTKQSLQDFVSLPILNNCILFGLDNDMKHFSYGSLKEMALLRVIPNGLSFTQRVLKEFGTSQEDHLVPQFTWYQIFKDKFTGLPLSHAESMLQGLAKESHVSPVERLDMFREVVKDLIEKVARPKAMTFKIVYQTLAAITVFPTAAAQVTVEEIDAIEAWVAEKGGFDNCLNIFRIHVFRNLRDHERALKSYQSLSKASPVANNLMLDSLARQANESNCPEILSSEKHKEAALCFEKCMSLFSEMLSNNKVDLYGFSIALRLAVLFKDHEKAKWILEELKSRPEIVPDLKLKATIIRYHALCGELEIMMSLYNDIVEKGLNPGHTILVSVIHGFSKALQNRDADSFFYMEYLTRYPSPEEYVVKDVLFSHAQVYDLHYFLPLYRYAVSKRLVSAAIFEKAMEMAIHFGDLSILKSALCDTFNLGLSPSHNAITLTVDFLVKNWAADVLPMTAAYVANMAASLLSDLPPDDMVVQRSFKRAVFQAAQIRLPHA